MFFWLANVQSGGFTKTKHTYTQLLALMMAHAGLCRNLGFCHGACRTCLCLASLTLRPALHHDCILAWSKYCTRVNSTTAPHVASSCSRPKLPRLFSPSGTNALARAWPLVNQFVHGPSRISLRARRGVGPRPLLVAPRLGGYS